MKKQKSFDCVDLKNQIQAQLIEEYRGLTDEQIRQRRAEKLATSDSPIGQLWRELQARDAAGKSR